MKNVATHTLLQLSAAWLITVGSLAAVPDAYADTSIAPTYRGSSSSSIASSVEVPRQCDTIFVSGMTGWDPGGARPAALTDTESQSAATLERIRAELAVAGATLGDVVMMRATLVPDDAQGNKADFAGYSRAYKRFFGTPEQPNKPARATYEGRLVLPGALVEIEVIAAVRCTPQRTGTARK